MSNFILKLTLLLINRLQMGLFTDNQFKTISESISNSDKCIENLINLRVLNSQLELNHKWSIIFAKLTISNLVSISFNTDWLYLVHTHKSITERLNYILLNQGNDFSNYKDGTCFDLYEESLCNGLDTIDKFEKGLNDTNDTTTSNITSIDLLIGDDGGVIEVIERDIDDQLRDYQDEEFYNDNIL